MSPVELRSAIEAAISDATGSRFRIERMLPAPGGCIHRSFVVEGGDERFFVKTNDAGFADAFAAEADGLAALIAAGAPAPRPICHGGDERHAWLAMQFLPLGGAGDFAVLGRVLAALHSTHGERHGWHRDNHIGATPQRNAYSESWSGFWRNQRLLPQLELARKNGLGKRLAEKGGKLVAALPQLLAGHEPAPSLLHGDLWSGNAGFLAGGAPVLFDPAVYYGDREADLAMTELFGGFPRAFYGAYRDIAPLDAGYAARKALYNLYHVLNHANLFGGGYVAQAETMIERLLAEIKS
ncbi:MAG: fructosamine kinase family protein [Burkholderiales bacterium]